MSSGYIAARSIDGLEKELIREIYFFIIHFFNYHSLWLIIAAVALFAAGWGLLEYWLRRNAKVYTVVNLLLLLLTVLFILSCTLLFRSADAHKELSLIPFDIIGQAMSNQVLIKSIAMNIVLFIPLSLFGLSLIRCRSNKAAVIFIVSGIVFSILIEALQYLLVLGQADIDDVLCNTAGLLIGFLLYRLYDRYMMKHKKKWR